MAILGAGGGIKSIQRGEATGTSTITINAVDPDKTMVNVSFTSLGSTGSSSYVGYNFSGLNHFSQGYGYGYGKVGGRAVLTDATTLTITATDANTTVYWEVVEYQ